MEIDPNVGSLRLPAPLPVSVSTAPAASFRDPAGFCFALDERVLRIVHPASLPALEAFLGSAAARKFLDARQLIPSHRLADGEVNALRAHPSFPAAMAGRDIGTVVFPNADYKFFLVASLDEKVRRRAAQFERRGERVDEEAMRKEVEDRDRVDTQRAVAPLRPAPDAVVIDTDRLDVDQVVDAILKHIGAHPRVR